MNVGAIREALADAAKTASGVTHALPYWPDKLTVAMLPFVAVGNPETIEYNRTFGTGHATLTFRLTCFVSQAGDAATVTAALDDFVSQTATDSLPRALRQTQSTEEAPWTVNVLRAENYGTFPIDSTEFYVVQLVVEVRT